MRALRFTFCSIIALCVGLSSCSLQKRHYRNGFYIENSVPKSHSAIKTTKKTDHSFQGKLQNDAGLKADEIFAITQISDAEQIGRKDNSKEKQIVTSKNKIQTRTINFISLLTENKNDTSKLKPRKRHDPQINNVPRAGLRMISFSLAFFGAALYIFYNVPVLFYFVLGFFLIAFLFAIVAMMTSISAGKDKIANDKKGIIMARITLALSILVFCAIALFFIFTPIVF